MHLPLSHMPVWPHSSISTQKGPTAELENPSSQMHSNEPGIFSQRPFRQILEFSAHSSTSTNAIDFNNYFSDHFLLVVINYLCMNDLKERGHILLGIGIWRIRPCWCRSRGHTFQSLHIHRDLKTIFKWISFKCQKIKIKIKLPKHCFPSELKSNPGGHEQV